MVTFGCDHCLKGEMWDSYGVKEVFGEQLGARPGHLGEVLVWPLLTMVVWVVMDSESVSRGFGGSCVPGSSVVDACML